MSGQPRAVRKTNHSMIGENIELIEHEYRMFINKLTEVQIHFIPYRKVRSGKADPGG